MFRQFFLGSWPIYLHRLSADRSDHVSLMNKAAVMLSIWLLAMNSTAIAQPSNDNFSSTIGVDLPVSLVGSNVDGTTESGEQQLEATGSTVWWFFDANQSGTVTIDTFGSDFDTQLHIYEGFFIGATIEDLIPLVNNDNAVSGPVGVMQSEVSFPVVEGERYEIRVGGFLSAQGNIVVNGAYAQSPGDPFEDAILALDPIVLWRLNESSGPTADNLGSLGDTADGTYGSQVDYGLPALPQCTNGNSVGLIKDVQSRVLLDPIAMPTGDLSISFWVQGEDLGLSHFFAYGTPAQPNEFTFGSDNGQFRAIVQGNINDYSSVDVLDGEAHHVGISRNGTTGDVDIYVDGQLVISDTFSTAPMEPSGAIAIGQDFDSPTPPYGFNAAQAFEGMIAEVCVFDRELTADEFSTLGQQNPYEKMVVQLAPQIFWPFNEDSGATIAANLGTLGAAADGLYGSEATLEQDALVGGTCGRAAEFTKHVDSVVLLDPAAVPIADLAVSFWVQGGPDFGTTHFFAYGTFGAPGEFVIGADKGEFRVVVKNDITDFPGVFVLDGHAHHVVVNRNGTTGDVAVYVDGRRRILAGFSASSLVKFGAIALGQDFDDTGNPPYGFDPSQAFNGTLDEVAVFDRLLAPIEIVPLADQGLLGDVNCDGAVNLLDVDPFIDAISGEYSVKADANGDGVVNLLDVSGFIALIGG